MPTPVSTARQCLTPEAAHALDEAVRVAKKRRHSQTTSLHAVSALLSHPSSALRDACSRARNSAYSPRLQFKALDLCLGVSLDRVPSTSAGGGGDGGGDGDENSPPVSNSLMAAIKRSQANQRRQPENFHLYHHHQVSVSSQQLNSQSSSSSSISCVKVDLRNLIMSILDDPVVSRVFSDAGFRSSDIKLAVFRPLTVLSPLHHLRPPPPASYSDPGPVRRGFSFPFPGFSGFFSGGGGSENFRRIGEVLGRSKGRNPLLLGVCACDTLASFVELLEKKTRDGNDNSSSSSILPPELSGLTVVRLEAEISQFFARNSDKEAVDSRFEEVGRSLDRNSGPGLVLNFGDLKPFVNVDEEGEEAADCGDGGVSYVVEKLTSSLLKNSSKLWLIGAAASYETYSKFVAKFPAVAKDWDLQLLPITTSSSMAAESSYPKSSLMESFIPFGGFFSTPSDFKVPLGSSPYHCMTTLAHPCNEQEVVAVSKGGLVPSAANQYQPGLRSWLQTAESGTVKEGMDMKTKDDSEVLRCRTVSLQEKHDSMGHSLHSQQSPPGSDIHPTRLPTIMGFRLAEDTQREVSENDYSCCTTAYSRPIADAYLKPSSSSVAIDSHQIVRSESAGCCFPLVPADATNHWGIISKQCEKPSNEDSGGALRSSPHSLLSNSSMCYGSQASPASVTTDLGLRLSSPPAANGEPINLKDLCRDLSERVGWQDDNVLFPICRTISEFRARDGKREGGRLRGKNIWFSFQGPDWHGKRKVAAAIAEMIYGSKENFVYANLNPQDGMNDSMLRGETVVDYVAGELSKRPTPVVLLENVDKADVQVQSSLSRAIQTGRFSDSHGREVSINNAIIITTSTVKDDSIKRDLSTYCEEKVLKAKGWPMLISVEKKQLGQELSLSMMSDGRSSSSTFLNKRKRADDNTSTRKGLDLNLLPAQETDDLLGNEGENLDSDDFVCDDHSSRAWLQGFFGQVDQVVMFKPFDFDTLATRISNEMNKCFHRFAGPECGLEIDQRVMEQLLAAEYLSDKKRTVEEWIDRVLGREFEEVRRKHGELDSDCTVKLVARLEGFDSEDPNPRSCLPPQVIIN